MTKSSKGARWEMCRVLLNTYSGVRFFSRGFSRSWDCVPVPVLVISIECRKLAGLGSLSGYVSRGNPSIHLNRSLARLTSLLGLGLFRCDELFPESLNMSMNMGANVSERGIKWQRERFSGIVNDETKIKIGFRWKIRAIVCWKGSTIRIRRRHDRYKDLLAGNGNEIPIREGYNNG